MLMLCLCCYAVLCYSYVVLCFVVTAVCYVMCTFAMLLRLCFHAIVCVAMLCRGMRGVWLCYVCYGVAIFAMCCRYTYAVMLCVVMLRDALIARDVALGYATSC